MNAQEAIWLLDEIAKSGDTEAAHRNADKVLCALLKTMGFDDVVEAWEKVEKWYA